MALDNAQPAWRDLPIRKPRITCERRDDGSFVIEQAYEMPPPWRSIPHLFLTRAEQYADRSFVAKRAPLEGGGWGDWTRLTYRDALTGSRKLAQAFLDLGLGPDAGVMVLSGPGLDHALVMLAAQMARAPYAPISPGYSLLDKSFSKLRHVFGLCAPKLIFVDDAERYGPALAALPLDGVRVISTAPGGPVASTAMARLLETPDSPAVDASIDQITPDTFAKVIFTSGSTGQPKGVIQTQRMLTAIIAQHDALYIAPETNEPEAYLNWMPWSHVGSSNIVFGDVINDGACLYIDEGKPVPGQFEETLRNLREVQPREFGSSPIFYSYMVAAMEAEPALRDHFFKRLRYLNYSTAGLSQDLFDRLQSLSIASTGQRIPIITKYGSTETQGVTIVSEPLDVTGPIGLPFPGITVKLAPVGDKLEVRARGDTITPGYHRNPDATAKSFDDEGFYCTGDAARFVDPQDPSRGLFFDGRVTENFKLATGTWVSVGPLRLELIENLSPLIEDGVIAGENRDDIRVMAWPRRAEAAAMAGLPKDAPMAQICAAPAVVAWLKDRLAAHNAAAGGSSRRVARLILLETPATGDEIADKGYINQRGVLKSRADVVARLYAADADPGVIDP